jgi:hypothetical protein
MTASRRSLVNVRGSVWLMVCVGLVAAPHLPGTASIAALTGQGAKAANVAGTWQMSVMHDHAIPFGLEIKQNGAALTATLVTPAMHGGSRESIAFSGTLAEATVTLRNVDDSDGKRKPVTIVGRLLDDGTMAGTLVGQMGEMKWTAERLGRSSGSGVAQLRPTALAMTWAPANVTGKWRMTITFNDGPRQAGLELEQSGRKVAGRLVATFAGSDLALEGEFANGQMTMSGSTTGGPHPGMQLDFAGTLGDDGALRGTLSSAMGDFKWTAERLD